MSAPWASNSVSTSESAARSSSRMRFQVVKVGQGRGMSGKAFDGEAFDKSISLGVSMNALRLGAEVCAGGMNSPAHAAVRRTGGAAIEGEHREQVQQIVLDCHAQMLGGNGCTFCQQILLNESHRALRREYVQVAPANLLIRSVRVGG